MSIAIARDIWQKIQAEDYIGALNQCKGLSDSQKNFSIHSAEGNCCMQLQFKNEAAIAFEKAVAATDAPGPQLQKVWKTLSDIHEELGNWDRYVLAMTKLYEINKAKGNEQRIQAIAELIGSRSISAKLFDEGFRFCVDHILELIFDGNSDSLEATASHGLRMSVILNETIEAHATAKLMTRSGGIAKSSLGSTSTATAAVTEKDPFEWAFTKELYWRILFCSRMCCVLKVDDGNCNGTLILCCRILRFMRANLNTESAVSCDKKKCNTGTEETISCLSVVSAVNDDRSVIVSAIRDRASHPTTLLDVCFAALAGLECLCLDRDLYVAADENKRTATAVAAQVLSYYLLESYSFLPSTTLRYEHIVSVIDRLLQMLPGEPLANCVRALGLVTESGRFFEARLSVGKYLEFAINEISQSPTTQRLNSVATAGTDGKKSPQRELTKSERSTAASLCLFLAVTGQAFLGFRDLSVSDMLCLTQEAVKRVDALTDVRGFALRGSLRELVFIARLSALAKVSQAALALEGALRLPTVFQISPARSADDKLVASDETNEGLSIVEDCSVPVRWLAVRLMVSVGLFGEAEQVCDRFAVLLSEQGTSSWIIAEKGTCMLMKMVARVREASEASGRCPALVSSALRDVVLPEAEVGAVVRYLKSALSTGDALCPEVAAEVKLRMGQAMWLAGKDSRLRKDKNGAIALLLESAKLDPTSGAPYSFIGHYYYCELGDADRAAKCYLKALMVDPLDREAGIGLTALYFELNQPERAIKMWTDVTSLTTHAQWCFALLGQYHLCQGNYNDSITALQQAVDLRESDANSWFGLGTCYANLQQINAAMKALQRAAELAPKDLMVLCSLGDVLRKQCLFEDSISAFDAVLAIYPNDAVALKGVADVCLALCFQYHTIGWGIGAARALLKGVLHLDKLLHTHTRTPSPLTNDTATAATTGDTQYVSVLKLLGDLCSFARHLSPQDLNIALRIPTAAGSSLFISAGQTIMWEPLTFITQHIDSASPQHVQCESSDILVELLSAAEAAYEQMISLLINSKDKTFFGDDKQKISSLADAYYDLGGALYHKAALRAQANGQGAGLVRTVDCIDDFSRQALQKACKAFLAGLKADPLNSSCWNGLGLSSLLLQERCAREYGKETPHNLGDMNDGSNGTAAAVVSQSCFVRAAQIDSNSSAYANLGALMLMHRRDDEARECYSALQLIESNPLVWVGIGNAFERSSIVNNRPGNGRQNSLIPQAEPPLVSAYNAYLAAVEVATPIDALLGSAITWLKINGLHSTESFSGLFALRIADVSCLPFSSSSSEPQHFGRNSLRVTRIRHDVEGNLVRFLRHRPVHPVAWSVLAWAQELRGAYELARESCLRGLRALDDVARLAARDGFACLEDAAFAAFYEMTISLLRAYRRCGIMLMISDFLAPSAAPKGSMSFHGPLSVEVLRECSLPTSELSKLLPLNSLLQSKGRSSLQQLVDQLSVNGEKDAFGALSCSLFARLGLTVSSSTAKDPVIYSLAAAVTHLMTGDCSACATELVEAVQYVLSMGLEQTEIVRTCRYFEACVDACGLLEGRSGEDAPVALAKITDVLIPLITAAVMGVSTDGNAHVPVLLTVLQKSVKSVVFSVRCLLRQDFSNVAVMLLSKSVEWHLHAYRLFWMLADLLWSLEQRVSGQVVGTARPVAAVVDHANRAMNLSLQVMNRSFSDATGTSPDLIDTSSTHLAGVCDDDSGADCGFVFAQAAALYYKVAVASTRGADELLDEEASASVDKRSADESQAQAESVIVDNDDVADAQLPMAISRRAVLRALHLCPTAFSPSAWAAMLSS